MSFFRPLAWTAILSAIACHVNASSVCSAASTGGQCLVYANTASAPFRNSTTNPLSTGVASGTGAVAASGSVFGDQTGSAGFASHSGASINAPLQSTGLRTQTKSNGTFMQSGATSNRLYTELAPTLSTKTVVLSGTTTTELVLGGMGMTSPVTLSPSTSGGILLPGGVAASSSASSLSGILIGLLGTVTSYENLPTSTRHSEIGPVINAIKSAEHDAEDLLDKLDDNGSHRGGCTASLFSILSCTIKDLENLGGKIEGAAENVIKNLLDHIETLAKALTDTSEDEQDKSSTTSSTSSSSCDVSKTATIVTDICSPTLSGSSLVYSCTSRERAISGCSVTGSTTTTTLTTSIVSSPLPTLEQYPGSPDDTADQEAASSMLYYQLSAKGLLPVAKAALGTAASDGGALSRHNSTGIFTATRTSFISTTSTSALASTTSPTVCSFVSTTFTVSPTSVETACACNDYGGTTTTVMPGGSVVACIFFMSSTLPITTIRVPTTAPATTVASSIDIVLANEWRGHPGLHDHYAENKWIVVDLLGLPFNSDYLCNGYLGVGRPLYQIATLDPSPSATAPTVPLSSTPVLTPYPTGSNMLLLNEGKEQGLADYPNCTYHGQTDGPGMLSCNDLEFSHSCTTNNNSRVECSPSLKGLDYLGTSFWPVVSCEYAENIA